MTLRPTSTHTSRNRAAGVVSVRKPTSSSRTRASVRFMARCTSLVLTPVVGGHLALGGPGEVLLDDGGGLVGIHEVILAAPSLQEMSLYSPSGSGEAAVLGAPVDDPLGQHRADARQHLQLLDRGGVEVELAARPGRRPRRPAAGRGSGRAAAPTRTCSPSARRRPRLSGVRSTPGSAPPATVSASTTRAPAASRTMPGRRTFPAMSTMTPADGADGAVTAGSPSPTGAERRRYPSPSTTGGGPPAPGQPPLDVQGRPGLRDLPRRGDPAGARQDPGQPAAGAATSVTPGPSRRQADHPGNLVRRRGAGAPPQPVGGQPRPVDSRKGGWVSGGRRPRRSSRGPRARRRPRPPH